MKILLIGYCVPYVFLGVLFDCLKGSMTVYLIALAMMMILFIMSLVAKKSWAFLLGNVVSGAISYGLSFLFLKAEKWSWYTKPFTPQTLIIIEAVLILVVQVVIWIIVKRIRKKKNKKEEAAA